MKQLKRILLSLALVLGVGAILTPITPVSAQGTSAIEQACINDPSATICQNKDEQVGGLIANVINVLLFVVGIISVIVIIVGGIMYATSAGDAGTVTKAKNTILYAVVGLAIAFFAYAIVNWVVKLFVK